MIREGSKYGNDIWYLMIVIEFFENMLRLRNIKINKKHKKQETDLFYLLSQGNQKLTFYCLIEILLDESETVFLLNLATNDFPIRRNGSSMKIKVNVATIADTINSIGINVA